MTEIFPPRFQHGVLDLPHVLDPMETPRGAQHVILVDALLMRDRASVVRRSRGSGQHAVAE